MRMVRARYLRKRLGLTQAEVARRSGVPQPFVSLIETGRLARPFPGHLERLARVLGENDPERLLDEVEAELVAR